MTHDQRVHPAICNAAILFALVARKSLFAQKEHRRTLSMKKVPFRESSDIDNLSPFLNVPPALFLAVGTHRHRDTGEKSPEAWWVESGVFLSFRFSVLNMATRWTM